MGGSKQFGKKSKFLNIENYDWPLRKVNRSYYSIKWGNKRPLSIRQWKVQTRTTTVFAIVNPWHNTVASNSGYQPKKEHQARTWDVQEGLACYCFWPRYAIFPYIQQSAYVLHCGTASAVLICNSGSLLLEIGWGRCYVFIDVNTASSTDMRVLRLLISSNGSRRVASASLGIQNHHCHAIIQPT